MEQISAMDIFLVYRCLGLLINGAWVDALEHITPSYTT